MLDPLTGIGNRRLAKAFTRTEGGHQCPPSVTGTPLTDVIWDHLKIRPAGPSRVWPMTFAGVPPRPTKHNRAALVKRRLTGCRLAR
jgi:hypothetical protein